jgi:hypothetical protein
MGEQRPCVSRVNDSDSTTGAEGVKQVERRPDYLNLLTRSSFLHYLPLETLIVSRGDD